MTLSSNGVSSSINGSASKPSAAAPRCPRRVVLLVDGDHSEVEAVLHEFQSAEVSGKRLHAQVQIKAQQHRGRTIAAEWLGPLGWTRFLWCRLTAG